ncbi:MAG: hypothetical protein ACTSQF_00135 [Candidatus Heimdallarchaeaceae archaeon]
MSITKPKVNKLQSISVKTATTPMGKLRKAGTFVFDEDNEKMYFLTADTAANKSLATISAKTEV